MACSSCSQNTCNCTSTSICETCIDVTSSECIYYKGYVNNSLSLPANFRFNTFAEKVLDRIGTLPASYDDYQVDDVQLDFGNGNAAKNTIKVTIGQTGGLSDVIDTISIIKHACLVSLTTNASFAVTTTAAAIPGSSIHANDHSFSTDTVTIGNTVNKRVGKQLVSGNVTFVPGSTQNFTFTLFEGSNSLKAVTVPGVSGVCQTISLKAIYDYASTSSTKTFTIKVASGSSSTTINILAGDFEVIEYEY
jgi:hypothetical protein